MRDLRDVNIGAGDAVAAVGAGPAVVRLSLLAMRLLLSVASAPQKQDPAVSSLWGESGELWTPSGQLNDFSFAGYHQGNDPLPSPPVTREVTSFRQEGMNDTAMFKAALQWANEQPASDDYIVLSIPPGTYTLTQPLIITRDKVVLRGSDSTGENASVLYFPKSLTDAVGKNPDIASGYYVDRGAYVTCRGTRGNATVLAIVDQAAKRGDYTVHVDSATQLQVGQYYVTRWTDVDGQFNNYMFTGEVEAPEKYVGSTRVEFMSKIMQIDNQTVTLERPLPYDIWSAGNIVAFYGRPDYVSECGIESLAFSFAWEPYGGHHKERGWNAIEFRGAQDSWARDIRTINADDGILANGAFSLTVTGLKMEVTKTRANTQFPKADADGHWGMDYSHAFDVLAEDFDIPIKMVHSVGTGMAGMFLVYQNGRFTDGNLDLHRGLSGPTLYTNIDVGIGTKGLHSGGPAPSGPTSQAGTTFWNIKSKIEMDPPFSGHALPDCQQYGPLINIVGVKLNSQAKRMCPGWLYEPDVTDPANLYEAQVARRRGLQLAAASVVPPA